MGTYVGLLRGINVGGKNKLPMAQLVKVYEAAGASAVRTYIQSGNVIFDAPAALAKRLPGLVSAALAARFGLAIPVLQRPAAALDAALEANPFPRADEATLHVAFLSAKPGAVAVASLEPNRSPGDAFAVVGDVVYLHCPHGFGKTKLTTTWLDAKLRTTSTVRNWNTVRALAALAAG